MFSWLVLMTIMASIAYFLLFPRTDLVDVREKPLDDAEAKRILLVHQAAVNFATTSCTDHSGDAVYTLLPTIGQVPCRTGEQIPAGIQINHDLTANDLRLDGADDRNTMFSGIVNDHVRQELDSPNAILPIKTRIVCIDANNGGNLGICDPDALDNLAAFVLTYVDANGYQEDMSSLPYMLGKAFDFQYTGQEILVNGRNTTLKVKTYCGRVENYDINRRALPPEFRDAGDPLPPFIVHPSAADLAINNTKFQIATLPTQFGGLANGNHTWIVCLTPLNSFSGTNLTSRIH